MKNRFVPLVIASIVLAIASLGGPANADGVSFFPRGNYDIRLSFENLQEYPEYDFYLKYGLGKGNPVGALHLTPVAPNVLTRLEGNGWRITSVYLCAVRRGQQRPNPPEGFEEGRKWLSTCPESGLQSDALPDGVGDRKVGAQSDGCEIVYQVRVEGNHLQTTVVTNRSPWRGSSTVLLGIGLSLGVAIVVIVWQRRSRRSSGKATNGEKAEPDASADPPRDNR
jgi:hypothetical protein